MNSALTHREFDHESVNNAAKNSDEVKHVPAVFEVTLHDNYWHHDYDDNDFDDWCGEHDNGDENHDDIGDGDVDGDDEDDCDGDGDDNGHATEEQGR